MMVALRHGFTSVTTVLHQWPQLYSQGPSLCWWPRVYLTDNRLTSVAPAYSCGPGFTSMAPVLTATGRRAWLKARRRHEITEEPDLIKDKMTFKDSALMMV